MKAFLILFVLAYAGWLSAEEAPRLYRSAYFLGRGDTGIAVADNEDAIFYNPAGVALGTGIYKKTILANPMIEISKDTRDVIKQSALQDKDPTDSLRERMGRPQHLGINLFSGFVFRRMALGAFASNRTTAFVFKDYKNGAIESVHVNEEANVGLTFTLAQDYFSKHLLVGLNSKYFKRTQAYLQTILTDIDTIKNNKEPEDYVMLGTGLGADFGIMLLTQSLKTPASIGLTVENIGDIQFEPDTTTDLPVADRPLKPLKQTLNVGISIAPGTRYSRMKFLLDLRDLLQATGDSGYKRTHIGLELAVRDTVGFTTGVSQGYPTGGFYVDLRLLRLDVGGYTEELGSYIKERPDTRFYFRLAVAL